MPKNKGKNKKYSQISHKIMEERGNMDARRDMISRGAQREANEPLGNRFADARERLSPETCKKQ